MKPHFDHASESFKRLNPHLFGAQLPRPQPERPVQHEPLAEAPRKEESPSRLVVRITGWRRKLLDPDNFAGGCKYVVDGLRYSGLIPDDTTADIRLETSQEKVQAECDERTHIVIERLEPEQPT